MIKSTDSDLTSIQNKARQLVRLGIINRQQRIYVKIARV